MRVFDAPAIRNVALVGHSGAGKTQLARRSSSTPAPSTGSARSTTARPSPTTTTRRSPASTRSARAWPGRVEQDQDQPHRHAGHRQPPERHARGAARRRRGPGRGRRRLGRPGPDRSGLEAAPTSRPAAPHRRQPARPRACQPRPVARIAARGLRPLGRSDHPPARRGAGFQGVVDLLTMKACTYPPDGSGAVDGADPGGSSRRRQGGARGARRAGRRGRRCADGALLRRGHADQRRAGRRPGAAVAAGEVFPVVCDLGAANVGDAAAARRDRPPRAVAGRPRRSRAGRRTATTTIAAPDDGPSTAFVWRTVADPFAGRITLFRVVTGTLVADTTGTTSPAATRRAPRPSVRRPGQDAHRVPEVKAGDLGAVAKLKETQSGDTLAEKGATVTFPPLTFPEPVLAYAIEPKTRGDEDKISTAAAPAAGRGSDHPLRPRPADQGAAALGPGPAPHRGDRRQAEAAVRRRRDAQAAAHPLPRDHRRARRGARPPQEADRRPRPVRRLQDQGRAAAARHDFEFVDEIFGGSIPRQFVPAVEKGIQDARMRGYLAGYPMVDFRAIVYDGSFHPVDSNELSFKMAGSLAFKDAMSQGAARRCSSP